MFSSRVRLFGIVTALVAASIAMPRLPYQDWLTASLGFVRELGAWGPVLVAAIYVPACLFFIPGSLITLCAGFVFGVVRAGVAVSVGSTLGATAAFLAGRTIARGAVAARVATSRKFQAIDHAVEQQGFKIVLLTRLSPVFPFNLMNYAFGLTKVSLRDYVLASWIGMLPGTLMYLYLGSAAKSAAELVSGRLEGGAGQRMIFGMGLVATVGVTVFVTRVAKRALAQAASLASATDSIDSNGLVLFLLSIGAFERLIA